MELGYSWASVKLFRLFSFVRSKKYDFLEGVSRIFGVHAPVFVLVPLLFVGSLVKGWYWRIRESEFADSFDESAKFAISDIFLSDSFPSVESVSVFYRVLWLLRYSRFDSAALSSVNSSGLRYFVIVHERGETVVDTSLNTVAVSGLPAKEIVFESYFQLGEV
jgi:hypothetical protein